MIVWQQIDGPKQAVSFIKNRLLQHLDRGERVTWLIPGGSAAEIARQVSTGLSGKQLLSRLSITLTDERYGPPGHKDSNWQLPDKGFGLKQANLYPVLRGKDLQQTADGYSSTLNRLLNESDYSMALAGIGPDGHIFGIKPGSPAVDSSSNVVGYHWDDYTRITPTINYLEKVDEVIIYAVGAEKRPQFEALGQEIPPARQPAQFLKRLKKVIILNDYKGEFL
jgi:6-phosphogluconolactonase